MSFYNQKNENTLFKILIIDDLDDNRTLLRLDLEDELPGVKIEDASNGFEALQLLDKSNFTLVLCDLMMPDMDGFEVYRRCKLNPKNEFLPFIFISANQDQSMAMKGLELGAFDFLKKPYDISELILKSRNLCRLKLFYDKQIDLLQRIEESNLMLEQINEQKDNVLRIVSHDMRNPLGNIIGLAQILSEEPNQPAEEIQSIADIMIRSGESLLSIVNTLLDAAKLESGKVDVNLSMSDLVSLIQSEMVQFDFSAKQKSIKLQFISDLTEANCLFDEPKIRQAIANLLSNAIKFTNENGEISIHLKRLINAYEISVTDTGIGISANQIPVVFEKFSPAQRVGTKNERGTGLGLSIVKAFIQLHKGEISVISKPNVGTTFKIVLPNLG